MSIPEWECLTYTSNSWVPRKAPFPSPTFWSDSFSLTGTKLQQMLFPSECAWPYGFPFSSREHWGEAIEGREGRNIEFGEYFPPYPYWMLMATVTLDEGKLGHFRGDGDKGGALLWIKTIVGRVSWLWQGSYPLSLWQMCGVISWIITGRNDLPATDTFPLELPASGTLSHSCWLCCL